MSFLMCMSTLSMLVPRERAQSGEEERVVSGSASPAAIFFGMLIGCEDIMIVGEVIRVCNL